MALKHSLIFLSVIYLNDFGIYGKLDSHINNLINDENLNEENYYFNRQLYYQRVIKQYRYDLNDIDVKSNTVRQCQQRYCKPGSKFCCEIKMKTSSYSDRQKRSPKIYPRTAVTLFRRKTRNNNQLNVRRGAINKRKFQSSHSPGIKQGPPKPKTKMIEKRSVSSENIEENESLTSLSTNNVLIQTTENINKNEETTRIAETQYPQETTKKDISTTPLIEINATSQRMSNDSLIDPKSESEKVSVANYGLGKSIDSTTGSYQSLTIKETNEITTIETSPTDKGQHVTDDNLILQLVNTTPRQLEVNETKLNNQEFEKQSNEISKDQSGEQAIQNITSNPNYTHINQNYTSYTQINKPAKDTTTEKLQTNGVLNATATTPATSTQQLKDISSNLTTTENTEITSSSKPTPSKKPVKRIKQIKPSRETEKWVKSNFQQLAIISVPYRKCPQGQRMRKGKCVQVY